MSIGCGVTEHDDCDWTRDSTMLMITCSIEWSEADGRLLDNDTGMAKKDRCVHGR